MEYPRQWKLVDVFKRCTPISEECGRAIEYAAAPFQAHKNEVIVKQGEIITDIYILSYGIQRIFLQKGDDEDTILFGGGGDVFISFHSFYCGQPSVFSLQALEDTEGWRLSHYKFHQLSAQFPELVRWMANLLVEQMFGFEDQYRERAMSTPMERFQNFWRATSDNYRNLPPNVLGKVIPLKYLAQYLGITPQTLSKLRRQVVGK